MKTVPPALAAHLAEGATTLCRCWILRRRDGVAMGFTDHDRDLVLDGVPCRAGTGLEAADATAELGFAVGGGDVAGALSSAGITEADIVAGRFDDASVESWLVNWAEPAGRMRLGLASIGEIRRRDGAFVAELRGPAHRLAETRGLTYRPACSAEVGDARCRVDLGPLAAVGTVADTDGALALSGALGDRPDDTFTGGLLVWQDGPNAGLSVEVKRHRRAGAASELDLWQRAPHPIRPGDRFRVTPGCDKRFATCRDRFANGLNFRGFPHMPGNDFVLKVARTGGAVLDGGSLFR